MLQRSIRQGNICGFGKNFWRVMVDNLDTLVPAEESAFFILVFSY